MNKVERFWAFICSLSSIAYYLFAITLVLLFLTLFSILYSPDESDYSIVNYINLTFLIVNTIVLFSILYICSQRERGK